MQRAPSDDGGLSTMREDVCSGGERKDELARSWGCLEVSLDGRRSCDRVHRINRRARISSAAGPTAVEAEQNTLSRARRD